MFDGGGSWKVELGKNCQNVSTSDTDFHRLQVSSLSAWLSLTLGSHSLVQELCSAMEADKENLALELDDLR